jgi:hypothetical protein
MSIKTLSWLGLGAMSFLVSACGAGGARDAAAPQSAGYGPSGAPAAEPGAPADMERSETAAAGERPGLGTEWGENRESRVSTTTFFRENPDRPFDVLKMFYNDRDGVSAMARRAGISDFSDGSAHASRNVITVRLLDSSGRPLEGFTSGGNTYVVGNAGDRYTIQIRNSSNVRFEAVTTVDGLDVINGRTGSFSSRGYIVNPQSTVEIDGWRRSTDTVAAFRFGAVGDSYAGKKGDDRNVGVIGVALFEERGAAFPWTTQEVDKRHDADPFPGRFAPPPPGF